MCIESRRPIVFVYVLQLVFIFALASLAVASHDAFAIPACDERRGLAHALSPDGKWIAEIFSNICGGDGFGSTEPTDTVEIRSALTPPSPLPSGIIFGMDYNKKQESSLAVNWSTTNELLVTVPNDASVGSIKNDYKGLRIVYKYIPTDDPVERLCIREWQRSSSEDTIPDFVAKCRKSESVAGRGQR